MSCNEKFITEEIMFLYKSYKDLVKEEEETEMDLSGDFREMVMGFFDLVIPIIEENYL